MSLKRITQPAAYGFLITFLFGGCFAKDALERARQLRTYTNMQAITGRIEELRVGSGQVSGVQIEEIVRSVADGRDQWGRPFVYNIRRDFKGFSYVVASLGSDGKLDVSSIEVYYSASPESIDHRSDRDIVFLNGKPLKNAGK